MAWLDDKFFEYSFLETAQPGTDHVVSHSAHGTSYWPNFPAEVLLTHAILSALACITFSSDLKFNSWDQVMCIKASMIPCEPSITLKLYSA